MDNPLASPLSPVSSRTLLALTEAIEHTFDASAWAALGLELDMPQLGDPEARLQESLRLREDDYGYFIAQFLRHLQDERPGALRDMAQRSRVRAWLDVNAPVAAQELRLRQPQVVTPVESMSASAALDQALKDADRLLGAGGPAVCVEVVHTALQGYLFDACARAGLSVADDETVARLFKSVRNGYPEFTALDQHDPRAGNVLASLAEAVTVLDGLRDHASISRPGQALLDEAGAMLMVNLVRTLYDYMRARL